jgi:xanthine dehydrogenase FAD-binding subunit
VKVLLPKNLEVLWDVLENEQGAAVYAGGTDLLVKVRAGVVAPPLVACLERIEALRGVRDEGDRIFIGSCTSLTTILESDLLRDAVPVLGKAVRSLGSPPIRNMATIGGNICTASPAGDTLPPLYLLDGEVELLSKKGMRKMALSRFITGPGKTALAEKEILSGIRVSRIPGPTLHHFEKVGQRKALAISIASFAALVTLGRTGMIEKARFAWGSVGPSVVVSDEVESTLQGRPLTVDTLRSVQRLVKRAVAPISDIRASAHHRRQVASNLILRLALCGDHI